MLARPTEVISHQLPFSRGNCGPLLCWPVCCARITRLPRSRLQFSSSHFGTVDCFLFFPNVFSFASLLSCFFNALPLFSLLCYPDPYSRNPWPMCLSHPSIPELFSCLLFSLGFLFNTQITKAELREAPHLFSLTHYPHSGSFRMCWLNYRGIYYRFKKQKPM